MQLNNQLQLQAVLKERKRLKKEKLSQERQVRLVSFMMVMGTVVAVISILKG